MQLFNLIFILFLLVPGVSYANLSSQQLTQGLIDLKNSVEQLSSGNEVLILKNTQLRERIKGRQLILQKAMEENQQLNGVFLKFQEINPNRAKQIERLQEDLAEIDKELNEWLGQQKEIQDKMEKGQKEIEVLDKKIDQILNPSSVAVKGEDFPQMSQEWHQKQKEKMAILKLIVESQNRQDLLFAQIRDFQRDIPGQDAAIRAREGYKLRLEEKIRQLQEEIALLKAGGNSPSPQVWDQDQVRQLQVNIDNLEKSKDELQALVLKMRQKAQQIVATSSQKHEQAKLQANIEQLKNETKGLRFDLEDLQRQMVSLDKRKAYLETLLQK